MVYINKTRKILACLKKTKLTKANESGALEVSRLEGVVSHPPQH